MDEWHKQRSDYQVWAESHPETDSRSPVAIKRYVEWLYANVPEHVRTTDPDPEKLGIQEMRRIFALLDHKLRSRIIPGTTD